VTLTGGLSSDAAKQTEALVQTGYNAVYAGTPSSPTLRRLWHEHAEGLDFPDEFGHISFVTVTQLRRMAGELRLGAGDTLVDLGCGRAGPALWMARETGANLVGVDLSSVAVDQSTARAGELGLGKQSRFVQGSFAETTLEASCADGVMSEDAIQYAPNKRAATIEAARILREGGRFVFTVFEVDAERAAGLPGFGADPVSDYRPLLKEAGFDVDIYEGVSGWPEPMTAVYSAVVGASAALEKEMGEAATRALVLEMSMTLEQKPYLRRVLVAATKKSERKGDRPVAPTSSGDGRWRRGLR
jgi:ubiquinone/menaquinone biosynthesis C-methylase UbiE